MAALAREAHRLSRDPFAARHVLGAHSHSVLVERVDPGRTDRRLALLEALAWGQRSGMTPEPVLCVAYAG